MKPAILALQGEKDGKDTKYCNIRKGGICKSTTSFNISAALSEEGYKIMQIGCDPKSDSTNTLRGGRFVPPYLKSCVAARGWRFNGILCVETGGPEPGVGCAGQMDRGYALDIIHYTGKCMTGHPRPCTSERLRAQYLMAWRTDIDPHGRNALQKWDLRRNQLFYPL